MTIVRRRPAAIAAATAVAVAALLGAGTTPALAIDEAPMSISDDGVTFSQIAGRGILDGLGLLIPGESVSSSMWVRNDSAGPAVVRVSIRDLVTPSTAYADGVSLGTWNSGTSQTVSNSLQATSRCSVIVPSQTIAAGDTMRFQLTFAMEDLTGETAQGQRAGMSLMIAMRDAAGGDFAQSACDDDGTLITPSPSALVPKVSTRGTPATAASSPSDAVQLPTESVPGAELAPVEIMVWGFTLLSMSGEDLTALFIISAGLASGVGMFVLAARRRRESEDA